MSQPKIKPVAAIKEYFGFKPDQKPSDFLQELKALSPEEKMYLAEGAARELGKELDLEPAKAVASN
jgi:hypothetical protein